MKAFIRINGNEYPAPNIGLGFTITTTVDSGRNEQNVVVGQRIGRDQYKIDSCVWQFMTAEIWGKLLQEFEKNFFVTVEFPDMVHNTWQTKVMYPGDRSAEPYSIDEQTGLPTVYRNCKCNLIDTGR